MRHASSKPSFSGNALIWRQQASTGGTSAQGKNCKAWNWKSVKQVIFLSHFLTHRSWHRAPQAEWYTWDFSETSFAPRGDYGSVPHNLKVSKGPGSNQDTYLLQLPAVSFSRRTLFIFCINYSASWAGQETTKEEEKSKFHITAVSPITGIRLYKSILHRSHFQLSGEAQTKSLVCTLQSKSVLPAHAGY